MTGAHDPDDLLAQFEDVTARARRPDWRRSRKSILRPAVVGAVGVAALAVIVSVAVLGSHIPGPAAPGPDATLAGHVTGDPGSPAPTASLDSQAPTHDPASPPLRPTPSPTAVASTPRDKPLADCRVWTFPEPEGELTTKLHLDQGLLEISYAALGMTIQATVEYLDPSCHTTRVVPELIEQAIRSALSGGGCDGFLELLQSGNLGYRGQPLSAEAAVTYYGRWCIEPPPYGESLGQWQRMPEAPIGDGDDPVGVWTGSELIVWGSKGLSDGGAYSPSANEWRELPNPRVGTGEQLEAVWTGDLVLAWHGGGSRQSGEPDGGAYDPTADTWTPLSPGPLDGGYGQALTWTGSELLVLAPDMRAAAYDPAMQTWRDLPAPPLLQGGTVSAWTGSEWLVMSFGGEAGSDPAGFAAFDPRSNTWRALAQSPFVVSNEGREPVWTGERLVFLSPLSESFAYDPRTDGWTSLGVPTCQVSTRDGSWTGSALIGGAIYELETGSCSPLPPEPDREGLDHSVRGEPVVVWTGSQLLIWGGSIGHGVVAPADGVVFTLAE